MYSAHIVQKYACSLKIMQYKITIELKLLITKPHLRKEKGDC